MEPVVTGILVIIGGAVVGFFLKHFYDLWNGKEGSPLAAQILGFFGFHRKTKSQQSDKNGDKAKPQNKKAKSTSKAPAAKESDEEYENDQMKPTTSHEPKTRITQGPVVRAQGAKELTVAETIKLEPPHILFFGTFPGTKTVRCTLTNLRSKRITIKVMDNDDHLRASPTRAVIDPQDTVEIAFQGVFEDGEPNSQKTYEFSILIAEAPLNLRNKQLDLQNFWGNVTTSLRYSVNVFFITR